MSADQADRPAALELRVLGEVTASRFGEPLPLGGRKQRAVLAVLALNLQRVIPVAMIADAVWDDDPPDAYKSVLQVYVSGLRRLAAPGGVEGELVENVLGGYRLNLPSHCVDLSRFRVLVTRGELELRRGEADPAAETLRGALAEWRGPAFGDLRGLRFIDQVAISLEEERLAALEMRIAADLAVGRHASLVGELASLVAEHPLRESLTARFAVALYRCGRQADALASLQALRAKLRDDVGLDPSPELKTLEEQLLRQDRNLTLGTHLSAMPRPAAQRTVEETGEFVLRAFLVGDDGRRVPVTAAGLRIGRHEDNDLVLDEEKVSRFHAIINFALDRFEISDLHSTNGTWVNGTRVTGRVALQEGDEIRMGSRSFDFLLT